MSGVRQHAVQLRIFPLLAPRQDTGISSDHSIYPYVCYTSTLSWQVLKAHFFFWLWHPMRYARAFTNCLRLTFREPKLLCVCLALFPKTIYYAKQIETLGIEHVHAHFAWSAAVAAGVLSDLTKVTFTVHTHAFDLFTTNVSGLRARLKKASRIVTISRFNADYIRRLVPDANVDIVRCGIEPERFTPVPRNHSTPVRILSVGRLIEKKGHKYLIDACALLAQRGVQFQCQIVGSGPLLHALQNQITCNQLNDWVTLLGSVREHQVLQLNQESDIFVLPCVVSADGDRDGLPVAIIEALACGVPVVSTHVTAVGELIEDGRTGLLVNQRDSQALADALHSLIANESQRLAMGKEGRARVLEEFTIQTNTARLARVFHDLAHAS